MRMVLVDRNKRKDQTQDKAIIFLGENQDDQAFANEF